MTFSDRMRASVARYRPSEHAALRDFQRQWFGDGSRQTDERCFAWRFTGHPLRHPEGPELWLCGRDGRIVGQQGGLPVTLWVAGQPVSAVWAIDLMVDPAWRLRGVGPALMQNLHDGRPLVCGLGISEDARRAFARAGWIDLGKVPRFVRLLRPLAPGQTPFNNWSASRRAARLSRLAAPVLRGAEIVTAGLALAARTRLEPVPAFDGRIDGLWRRAAARHPVIACRDSLALAWRFDAAPGAADYRRFYLWQGRKLVGYAVLRRVQGTMTVVDYLCDPPWLAALFAHCVTVARRQGAVALAALCLPPGQRAILAALGFIRRSGPRLMIAPAPSAELPLDLLSQPGNWVITESDSDLDHDVAAIE